MSNQIALRPDPERVVDVLQSDASLPEQTNPSTRGTIPPMPLAKPDRFFTAEQIHRLQFLMRRSQAAAEKTGPPLTPEEEAERNALIEAELLGSAQRIAAYIEMFGK